MSGVTSNSPPLSRLKRPTALGVAALVLTLLACGDDSSNGAGAPAMEQMGPNPDRFFEAPPEIASWTMITSSAGEADIPLSVEHEGTVAIDAQEFTRIRGVAGGPRDEEISASIRYDGDHLEIGEAEVLELSGLGSVGLKGAPVRVQLNPPVGEEQSLQIDGWELDINGQVSTISITGHYTLFEEEATVETPQGEIGGCRHYRGKASAGEISGHSIPLEGEAEIWVKTGVGIVAGWIEVPLIDGGARRTFHLEHFQGGGEIGNGRAVVRGDSVIGPQTTTSRVSSYDLWRDFDADKDTHAQFLIELRWSDPERARTEEQPPVNVSFNVPFGYLPHPGIFPLDASILNPHENGHGYRFWYAFTDQAARNMESNGIFYEAEARWVGEETGTSAKVNVSSMVNYRLYREE